MDGWAQGFTVPAGGGRLVITRPETARNLSLGAEAVALLVALVLALPGSRSSVPAPAAEAVPPAEGDGERRPEGARERRPEGAREQRPEGAKERRLARPQPAMAGVTAGGAARAEDGDDTRAGYPAADGAADDGPFGTHDDPRYAASSGFGSPEPALGVPPDLDSEPAPWAGLVPKTPQDPALRDQPDSEPAARPARRPARQAVAPLPG